MTGKNPGDPGGTASAENRVSDQALELPLELAAEFAGLDSADTTIEVIGEGLGVFSTVYRVESRGASVVVKLPRSGPNGDAARSSGAYERERTAYEHLLISGQPAPRLHGVRLVDSADGVKGPAFVLEDLTMFTTVDQLVGLSASQAISVVDPLFECHATIRVDLADQHGVRRVTPRSFDPEALARGVDLVPNGGVYERLLADRDRRIATFADLTDPVVCHGDPRADNLVVAPEVKLFDWQQIAVQAGEADLAWLAATSLVPRVRRACEADLVSRYAVRAGRSFDETWHRYRAAMIVPGLAVLLLAQRRAEGRLQQLVATSVERISTAVSDHFGD